MPWLSRKHCQQNGGHQGYPTAETGAWETRVRGAPPPKPQVNPLGSSHTAQRARALRVQRQGRVPTSFSGNSVLTSAAISTPAEPPPTTTTDCERWTWSGRKHETHPQTQPALWLGQGVGSLAKEESKLGVQMCFLRARSHWASPRLFSLASA